MIDNKFAQGEDGLSDNMDLAQTILNSIATIDNISGIEDMHDAISSTLGMIGEKTGAERVYIFDRQDDNPDVYKLLRMVCRRRCPADRQPAENLGI